MNGCLRPQLIYNKTALNVLKVRSVVYTPDGVRKVRLDGNLNLPSDLRLRPCKHDDGSVDFPSDNNLSDCFGVECSDGSLIPLYEEVPCGNCALCRNSLRSDWACRSVVEGNSSHFVPLFVTLTYDDEHLPKDGVNRRDVQLFLKRLRKTLACRYPYFSDKKKCLDNNRPFYSLRYLGCSEYGKKGRAHYHLELFNVPYVTNYISWKLIESCWQNGFVYVTPCNSGSCRYITKYMTKDTNVPDGQNNCFFMCSRGRGEFAGIGSQYLSEHQLPIDATYIELVDHWSDNKMPVKFSIPKYYKCKYWPSLSQMIPVRTRPLLAELNDKCRELAVLYNVVLDRSLKSDSFDFYKEYYSVKDGVQTVAKLFPNHPIEIPELDCIESSVSRYEEKLKFSPYLETDSVRFSFLPRFIDKDGHHESVLCHNSNFRKFFVNRLAFEFCECLDFVKTLLYWLSEDAKQINNTYIASKLDEREKRKQYLSNVVSKLPNTNESKMESLKREMAHYDHISTVD